MSYIDSDVHMPSNIYCIGGCQNRNPQISWTLTNGLNYFDVTNYGITCEKVGIPGYLKLIRDASKTSWSEAVKQTFGVEKKDLYREMATYMMTQYRLARANTWSYEELWKVPFGR